MHTQRTIESCWKREVPALEENMMTCYKHCAIVITMEMSSSYSMLTPFKQYAYHCQQHMQSSE